MQPLVSGSLISILLLTTLQWPQPVLSQVSSGPLCNGVFDLYFVLDSSISVRNNYRSNIVPFVEQVIGHYAQSGFRIAIVTFDAQSVIRLPLTPITNQATIQGALNNLRNVQLGGRTILAPALRHVNRMIVAGSGSREITSIILIVTDGKIIDSADAQSQAQIAQAGGSTVFAVGVGQYNYQQLLGLTVFHERIFTGSDFNSLHQILDKVVEEICITITVPNTTVYGTAPLKYCRGQTPTINISGSGFETLNYPNCHFWTPIGQLTFDQWPTRVTNNTILCPTPVTGNHTGELYLQVTTRSKYKENETVLFVEDCRKLSEAHPNHWCVSESVGEVNVSGEALTDGVDRQRVHCNYTLETGEQYTTYPFDHVIDNKICCPTKSLNENFTLQGVVTLRVSLNGVDYVPNSVFIRIDSCTHKTVNIALIAGIIGGLLGLIALLTLCCLLWCLFPLITGTIVGGLAQEDEPPPVPTPPIAPPPPQADTPRLPGRKWDVVDASYYGIRGAGGIRPAKVQWGNKGTTEEGAKLIRAKDAVKLGEVEVPGPPAPPTNGSGMMASLLVAGGGKGDKKPCCCILCCLLCYKRCCGVVISKIKRCYKVIASYRPVFTYHGTLGKRVLCCPGPNVDEKLKANGTSETTNGRLSNGSSSQRHHWRLPRSNRNDIQERLLLN